MQTKIYTKDVTDFYRHKPLLDGCVFWHEAENNKVEIILVFNILIETNLTAGDVIRKLKN